MELPEEYLGVDENELTSRIMAVKKKLGKELVILAHHYQRDEIYALADFTGDSFMLAKNASEQKDATNIVFCGVHFMAEAASILCGGDQRVFLPDLDSGCPMADMASIDDVETAWDELSQQTDISKVIPITYMNSTADIKAFCGERGGAVCTSSNAQKIFKWAFEKGKKIFFFPDEHLGRNTARAMGIKNVERWSHSETNGGLDKDKVDIAEVIVWDGFCHVHTHFTKEHIHVARQKYPDARVIVHPECTKDVVISSDASGSTEQIRQFVENAKVGSTIIVGTEIHLVSRLAKENAEKTVLPLARSLCPNMFKISLHDLCWVLESLPNINEIAVSPAVKKGALLALKRMLAL